MKNLTHIEILCDILAKAKKPLASFAFIELYKKLTSDDRSFHKIEESIRVASYRSKGKIGRIPIENSKNSSKNLYYLTERDAFRKFPVTIDIKVLKTGKHRMLNPPQPGNVVIGDNLIALKKLKENSIDLIVLDPPYNSKRDYEHEKGSFKDTWTANDIKDEDVKYIKKQNSTAWDFIELSEKTRGIPMKAFLTFMTVRLIHIHRILKDTGTLYLHIDPKAGHYIKFILDTIFEGEEKFRNEIIWFYDDTPGRPKNDFPRKHDVIFRYTKSPKIWTFNGSDVLVPIKENSKKRYEYDRTLGGKTTSGGTSNTDGKIPEDVWAIPSAKGSEKEKYPTQKPLELLRRIILASSNKDDIVLDPFCGSGTTLIAAEEFGRKWIGCDLSPEAGKVVKNRMKKVLKPLPEVSSLVCWDED